MVGLARLGLVVNSAPTASVGGVRAAVVFGLAAALDLVAVDSAAVDSAAVGSAAVDLVTFGLGATFDLSGSVVLVGTVGFRDAFDLLTSCGLVTTSSATAVSVTTGGVARALLVLRRRAAVVTVSSGIATIGARLVAARRAFVGSGFGAGGAIAGVARSMLRRPGVKLCTTRDTLSPTPIISRALRGAGSAISRSGT